MTDPGLCGSCRNARRTRNRRGSVFFLCALSSEDSRFPRYPPLPVVRCLGYVQLETGPEESRGVGGEGAEP